MGMKVILYTGGLDSFIGLWLLQRQDPDNWVPVYFDTGSCYAWKEKQAITQNAQKGARARIVSGILDLSSLETTGDPYVPQRNTLLCAAVQAVYDGAVTDIALCSVMDDVYSDNGTAFHVAMSHLLSLTAGYNVRVFSPLLYGEPGDNIFGIRRLMTKQEAVEKYLELGGEIWRLNRTVSCYDSQKVSCGQCKACERHKAALRTIADN